MYYIAEIGLAHDGSLGIAHSYIDALARTGIDAVKFQMHLADYESSSYEKFRVNFSFEDSTRFDYWKRTSFTIDQWIGLKEHCERLDMDFLLSPFSIEACKRMETMGLNTFKIGSGELSNFLMLDHLNKKGNKIILSSGLSNYNDLDKALNRLDLVEKKNITLLQCTTSYPTKPEEWGLNNITLFKDKYKDITIGYSDHSGEIFSALAAITLGAQVVEFHTVFDKKMFGPDSKASLTINEIKQLVKGGDMIDNSLKCPIDKDEALDINLSDLFGKTLAVNKDLNKGETIKVFDLESKKPAKMGISAKDYENIINKTLARDIKAGDFLKYDFFDL